MPSLIYTAPFQLTNPVTKAGFIKAQRDLHIFSDVSEWIDETIINRDAKVAVSAKLNGPSDGIITVQSQNRLNHLQLKQISQIIFINLGQLNVFLLNDTPTINHQNYTAVKWSPNKHFHFQNITQPLN